MSSYQAPQASNTGSRQSVSQFQTANSMGLGSANFENDFRGDKSVVSRVRDGIRTARNDSLEFRDLDTIFMRWRTFLEFSWRAFGVL